MALTIGLISEMDYSSLNLTKVFKMLVIKELTKANSNEQSVLSREERKAANRNAIVSMTSGLSIQAELVALYDESVALQTDEAKFVLYVSKLESDLQAKKYELDGEFTLDNAMKDINNYPEDIKAEVLPQVENASDGWILFDRRYYNGDEAFESLSRDIQKLK
jgi:cell division protein YceG involved in septum cleavage